jgi:hypothetical protein
MGKKNKGKGGTKVPKKSSGLSYARKCKRQAMRLEMKIKRWKRNQGDPGAQHVFRKGQQVRDRSRYRNWNTEGLQAQADWLRAQAAKGKRNRKTWY